MKMPHPHPDVSGSRRSTVWALGIGLFAALWILWSVLSPWLLFRREPGPPPGHPEGIRVSMETAGLDLNLATDLLVEAVVQIESQGNPRMVGGVGERGLMQIRESTWNEVTQRHFGEAISFDRAFEPELNRRVGRLYLGDLQVFLLRHRQAWRSDVRSLLLACYNAGPERVRSRGFHIEALPARVQSYVERGCALHDWYLKENAPEMRKLLSEPATP